MTGSRKSLAAFRIVTTVALLLCVCTGLFFAVRAGQKWWWIMGAAALAVPGCVLAGDMLLTLLELRGRNLAGSETLPKLSTQLRWSAMLSFILLIWMSLLLVGQPLLHPIINWVVLGGVSVTFPVGLLLTANALDRIANRRPAASR